jgi:lactoylglutathione lyase
VPALLDPDGYRIELLEGEPGFAHAGVTVSDLERSLAFYRDALGLELVDPAVTSSVAVLEVPGSGPVLQLVDYDGDDRYCASCRPCDYGARHVCLYVDDVRGLCARVLERGYGTRAPVAESPNGLVVHAIDGDGYHVELFERAPR